jgi:hypothetical protein
MRSYQAHDDCPKYGTPSGPASHNAPLSDVHQSDAESDAPGAGPSETKSTNEYDDTHVSASLRSVAFSAFAPPGRDLSQSWVVNSACSIRLTAFRSDFVSFDPPSGTSHVGGVGVDVRGRGKIAIAIPFIYGQIIHRSFHALHTLYLSARCEQRIGRLRSVRCMMCLQSCY